MQNGQIPETISYYAHEAAVARSEAHARRWMIGALIAFAALIVTNTCWLIYESRWKDEVITQEVTQDSEGGSNENNLYYGDYNGEADRKNNDKT